MVQVLPGQISRSKKRSLRPYRNPPTPPPYGGWSGQRPPHPNDPLGTVGFGGPVYDPPYDTPGVNPPGFLTPGMGVDPVTGVYTPPVYAPPTTDTTDTTTTDTTDTTASGTDGYWEDVESGYHWDVPDYRALIAQDPAYMAALATIQANLDSAQRRRIMNARQAVAEFGAAPEGMRLAGDIDEATLAAARENPYSTLRTLTNQRQQGGVSLAQRLASRGVLSSGALTGGQRGLQSGYEQGLNTGTKALLGQLGQLEDAWGQALTSAGEQQGNALTSAGQRVFAQYPASQVKDFTKKWVPGTAPPAATPPATAPPTTTAPTPDNGLPWDPTQPMPPGLGTVDRPVTIEDVTTPPPQPGTLPYWRWISGRGPV